VYLDLLSHRPGQRRLAAKRVWAEHVVRRWKRRKPAILASLAAVVLALGVIGFRMMPSDGPGSKPFSLLESFYRAPQLFGLGGGDVTNPNIYLQVARFLAPFVLGYAALGAVFSMYRDELNRFLVRHLRRHVVIAGLGAAGSRLAKAFSADGWPVVAVERDAANTEVAGCRQRGVRVLLGDATDRSVLRQAGLDHAVLLVSLCGEDRANIDVTAAARTACTDKRKHVLTAVAGFDDFYLWHAMKAPALVDRDSAAFRLELVNLWALAAELLLDAYPPFHKRRPGCPHVVVVSDEGLAASLVIAVLRRWMAAERQPPDRLRLSLAGAPPAVLASLSRRNPELVEIPSCTIEPWDDSQLLTAWDGTAPGDGASDGASDGAGSGATAVYVALASETAALTTALNLRDRLSHPEKAPVVVVVEDDGAGVAHAIRRGGLAMQGIHAFGWLSHALRPDALLEGMSTEVVARLGHQVHCEQQRSLGLSEADDPSLGSWERLPSALRESNRVWADGIAAKLAGLRCAVTPAPLIDPEKPNFEFTEEEVEKLAPLEHERWSSDMKRMGYRPGPRDATHRPYIDVPFDELPEANKEKDRAHVRMIPRVLARAGFRVQRLSEHATVASLMAAALLVPFNVPLGGAARPPFDGAARPPAHLAHIGAGIYRRGPVAPGRYLGPAREKTISFTVLLSSSRRPSCLEGWAHRGGLSVGWWSGQSWAVLTGAPLAVDRDFGVAVGDYEEPGGKVIFAADRPARAPRACGEVAGVGAIRSALPPEPMDVAGYALSGVDLMRAYDALPLADRGDLGQGETVVFIETGGYNKTDLQRFAEVEGLRGHAYDISHMGANLRSNQDEATMDLETVHEIAPDARLVYVNLWSAGPENASVSTLLADAITKAARRYRGAVFSISLGFCEASQLYFQKADVFGLEDAVLSAEKVDKVTAFAASGDSGGLDCTPTYPVDDAGLRPQGSYKGVLVPAVLPAVTGVGGTTLGTDASGDYAGEAAWDSPLLSQGSGGGVSQYFSQPAWQKNALGAGGLADYNGHRQVPDVSADADPYTGNLTVQGAGVEETGGGTSLATPIWAGFTALIDRYLGQPVGFFNPLLYEVARAAPYPAFHDVTEGGNDYYAAGPGYDMVTGLGTPDVWDLARDLQAVLGR
jgi:kumamolisin